MAMLVAIGYPDQTTAEEARQTVQSLEADLIIRPVGPQERPDDQGREDGLQHPGREFTVAQAEPYTAP